MSDWKHGNIGEVELADWDRRDAEHEARQEEIREQFLDSLTPDDRAGYLQREAVINGMPFSIRGSFRASLNSAFGFDRFYAEAMRGPVSSNVDWNDIDEIPF